MKSRISLLIFAVLVCGAFAQEKAADVPIQPTALPPTTPTPPPTTPPTTASTTTKPTTSTTTTTTPKPTTPTSKTTTVTPPPTPNTTTTMQPTTTVKPVPVPEPKVGEWMANITGTNRTCLVLQMAVQIEFMDKMNKTIKMNLPENATAVGSCDAENEWMQLMIDNRGSFMRISIQKSNNSKYHIDEIEAYINITTATQKVPEFLNLTHHRMNEFDTPVANSYRCLKKQTLDFNGTVKATMEISQFQMQAFRNETGKQFSSAIDCEGSQTPDVVPIAVGCVLVALIVMILVGYLYGRRYCQARGYLSM